jgi:rubrerythrin
LKLSEVEVGGRYTAKVSGRVVTVRVVEIVQVEATRFGRARTSIEAVNEATGRRVSIRSPLRLRRAVRGCEFCRQACNRPEAGFTCPYCQTAWPAAVPTR